MVGRHIAPRTQEGYDRPWSTRQLAEPANTTVNTVRHYHRLGLLNEPERRYNAYKQYEVQQLVSLLRIRRIAELGVPLSQISTVGAGADRTPGVLRNLHTELQRHIERLKKARTDIAAILRARAAADAVAAGKAERATEAPSFTDPTIPAETGVVREPRN
ncbi:MerR family transcriptional regulator [Streptomyces phaeochromogenes]|nr:MerR family transcriptional regulator [Streptomyces phaeochromogenes]